MMSLKGLKYIPMLVSQIGSRVVILGEIHLDKYSVQIMGW